NSAPRGPVTLAMARPGSWRTGSSLYGCASWLAGNKKAPVLFRRGFGSDNAIVRLRAHGSRAPGGCFGFRGRFGRSRHGADLCGRFELPSTGFGLIRASTDGARSSPACGARRLEDHLLQVAATHDDDRK